MFQDERAFADRREAGRELARQLSRARHNTRAAGLSCASWSIIGPL